MKNHPLVRYVDINNRVKYYRLGEKMVAGCVFGSNPFSIFINRNVSGEILENKFNDVVEANNHLDAIVSNHYGNNWIPK